MGSASYTPRHIELPPTRATGAITKRTECVRIALDLKNVSDSHEALLRALHHRFTQKEWMMRALSFFHRQKNDVPPLSVCEDELRTIADATIKKFGLVGCILLVPEKEIKQRGLPSVLNLDNHDLAFAILTKSSDRIFVAAKTPNLTSEMLLRELYTFDPRIA